MFLLCIVSAISLLFSVSVLMFRVAIHCLVCLACLFVTASRSWCSCVPLNNADGLASFDCVPKSGMIVYAPYWIDRGRMLFLTFPTLHVSPDLGLVKNYASLHNPQALSYCLSVFISITTYQNHNFLNILITTCC